jgi:hypothetical protein
MSDISDSRNDGRFVLVKLSIRKSVVPKLEMTQQCAETKPSA